MIETFGQKLYTATEVSLLIGVSRETLGIYARKAGVPKRIIQRVRYYTEEEMRRHSVRPGLTGNAQVNGRNEITWERKFALDLEYVDHITFRGDCHIIGETFRKVFSHEGTALNAIEDFDVYRKKQWEAAGISGNADHGAGKS